MSAPNEEVAPNALALGENELTLADLIGQVEERANGVGGGIVRGFGTENCPITNVVRWIASKLSFARHTKADSVEVRYAVSNGLVFCSLVDGQETNFSRQ